MLYLCSCFFLPVSIAAMLCAAKNSFPPSQSISDGYDSGVSHLPDMLWWPRLQSAVAESPSGAVLGRIVTASCLASPMTPFLYVLHALVSVLMALR